MKKYKKNKNQGNMSPPKVCNSSVTKSKDSEVVEMSPKALKSLIFKTINDIKEDTNKQINEVKNSIQDLDKKFSKKDTDLE
jgi:Fe-S-cluster-containing dehydrogenase component